MSAAVSHARGHAPEDRLARLPGLFEGWEARLSRFRPQSELCRLNDTPGVFVPVSDILWQTLQAARRAEKRSGGLVTVAMLDAVIAAGYSESFEHIGQTQVTDAISEVIVRKAESLAAIELDHATRSVKLPVGLRLDFGGVAKGWAAEQAARLVERSRPGSGGRWWGYLRQRIAVGRRPMVDFDRRSSPVGREFGDAANRSRRGCHFGDRLSSLAAGRPLAPSHHRSAHRPAG